jgi:hypothetical protein
VVGYGVFVAQVVFVLGVFEGLQPPPF